MTAAYSVSCACLLYGLQFIYTRIHDDVLYFYIKMENSILSVLKTWDLGMSQLKTACWNETPFSLEKQVDDFVGIVCELAPKIWVVEMIKCLFTNIASCRTL